MSFRDLTNLRFKRKQKVYNIAGIHVGGQPGERSTVLIGTIFYTGHNIVSDPTKGIFDREKASELLLKQDSLSKMTGIPCMVDVAGLTGEALAKYIEFVAGVTRAPILVDSSVAEARLEACRHAVEIGLGNRIIYSTITPHGDEGEIEAIKEIGLETAIVLAFGDEEFLPEQKLRLLKGNGENEGLLQKVKRAGVKKVLIDVSVLDAASVAYAVSSIRSIKDELGLPSGCAPANIFDTWQKVNEFGKHSKKACYASLAMFIQSFGADFILYGPIGMADVVFPACALADAIITYNAVMRGHGPKDENTPLYKIF